MMRENDTISEVAEVLRDEYGDFAHFNKSNPFDELLFIICSVMTQESKYLVTYEALKSIFPTGEDLATAEIDEIEKLLTWGGLAKKKAKMIRDIVLRLKADFGEVTLDPLIHVCHADRESYLLSLPGVGKKIARCILLYSFEDSVFPIDTHCWRISKRLGWTKGSGWCSGKEMDQLQNQIPPDLRYSLHVNMVSHGRAICTPHNPRCSECQLRDLCPTGSSSAPIGDPAMNEAR